jgi:hypothetical protein
MIEVAIADDNQNAQKDRSSLRDTGTQDKSRGHNMEEEDMYFRVIPNIRLKPQARGPLAISEELIPDI